MAKTSTIPFKKGSRVIATEDLRDVPEGTQGRVRVIDGLGPWIRCWVQFDNGVWLGSVGVDQLVIAKDWDAFKVRRAEEAEAAARRKEEEASAPPAAAAAGAAATGGDGGGAPAASEAASKVPAHLLERSRQARERKAAAASGE